MRSQTVEVPSRHSKLMYPGIHTNVHPDGGCCYYPLLACGFVYCDNARARCPAVSLDNAMPPAGMHVVASQHSATQPPSSKPMYKLYTTSVTPPTAHQRCFQPVLAPTFRPSLADCAMHGILQQAPHLPSSIARQLYQRKAQDRACNHQG